MKEINIKIEGKEWEEAVDKAFIKANAKVKIDGFRLGKAPKDVFLKKYSKESLFFDAADLCIQTAYSKMLDENKDLIIVAQPEMELKTIDEKGCEFTFKLTLKPEVKLGKYTGLKVKKEKVEVSKEEITKTIDEMRNRFAENVTKEGTVENGDTAIINFEGFKDSIAFEGGKGENYSLKIGSNTFIPGFEEQIIGMGLNEEKDINVTFPEDYHAENLKGAPVVFKVKINEIKTTTVPAIDDNFFADLGMEGINTIEALEKQIEENIKAHKEMDIENKYMDELLAEAAKGVKCDVPEAMVNEEINRMIKQYEENMKMQGLTLEQFYQFTNSDKSKLREEMHGEAHKRVLYRLMLEEIVAVEKFAITEEEINEETDRLATRYGMNKEEFLTAFGGTEMVKYDLEMRKGMEKLKEAK